MSSSSFKELEDPIEDREERIYVGGLDPPNLTVQEISRRLQNIPDIEIIPSQTHSETNLEDDSSKSYVHITAISKNPPLKAVDIIAKLYNNVKWKGCRIKIEEAKPHFLERLKDEQKVRIEQQQQQQQQQQNVLDDINDDIDGDDDYDDDEDIRNKGSSNIPRRLKIRKRYGQPAYYIDTKPWNIVPCNNNWSKFSMARKKLQKRADKHKQQNQNNMNNKKKATALIGTANAAAATTPTHSNSNYHHRAIHMRFGDSDGTDDGKIISEREKEEEMESSVSDDDSDDKNSPNDTTTGGEESDSFSDDDNDDGLETGVNNMVNSSAATKKDTSYVWSDDDDDDSNEEEKGENKESNKEDNEVNSMISSEEDEEEIEGGGGIESHNDDDDDDVEEEEAEDDDSDQSSPPYPIQGSNIEQSLQRLRQQQLQEEGYMWSTSSSNSDSSSDDGDAEESRKINVDNTNKHQPFMTAATPSSAMDEFAAGWSDSSSEGDVSDDDESKNDSKPGSQQQQQPKAPTIGTVDLKEDVSTNMEILAGIFPELATTKRNRIDFIDDDGQDEESSLQQQGHSLPRNNGNANSMVLMPRFDPNDMTTHKFVLDDDINNNNKIKASNHDKDNGSNDEKIYKTNADKNEDCDSVAESFNNDKDNSKDGEQQQEEELAIASPEIQQQRQGQLYEEKKLEDVFREARTARLQQQVQRKTTQGPAATVTTGYKSSSSGGGGGFSFGFFDSAGEGDEGVSAKTQEEESPAVVVGGGGGFTFGFSLPTPTSGDGDTSSAVIENKQQEEEEEDERKTTIPTEASMGGIEGGNSNNNNNKNHHRRHRGMFMPSNIVDNIVGSIFYGECNDVKNKILSNPDTFRNSIVVKSQWMKERQSLTIDWKRKRKYAQTRIQKRMKLR